jgi:hypothetical protein
VTTTSLTDIAETSWLMGLVVTSWLLAHMDTSWLMGIAPLAVLVVWVVSWTTKGSGGDAILHAGIVMGLAQLATAAWIIWQ